MEFTKRVSLYYGFEKARRKGYRTYDRMDFFGHDYLMMRADAAD